MQYTQNNGIGMLLAVLVGVSVFAGWLYTCYPVTASLLADDSRQSWSFLVLIGFAVIAVVGVVIAGAVLQGLMQLLRSLMQLALIVFLVVGGVILWRRGAPELQSSGFTTVVHSPPAMSAPSPQPHVPTNGRWWEQPKE